MARDRRRGAGTFKGRRTGPPEAQKRLEGRAGGGREREMWHEEKVKWRGIKWASPGVTSGRCPGDCPLLSTPSRACNPCTAPHLRPPGARAPEPPVRRARRRKPGPRRRRESSRSYYCPSSSTLPRPTGTRVHGLPGYPPPCPAPIPQSPRHRKVAAGESVPALSSKLTPSLPALLLPAPLAGPGPYLTTAAKDDDDEAAGAVGGGGGAGVLGWLGGAAGVQDGDDDEAAAAAGARPAPAG